MANTQSPNGTKPVELTTKPLPASHKVYVHSHHRPEISVAMRAVVLSNASNGNGHAEHANAPLMIYDTSGPYTDPNVQTDIRQGLKPLRLDWIRARGDVEELPAAFAAILPYFDQYHQSATIWSPDSNNLVLSFINSDGTPGIAVVAASGQLEPRLLTQGYLAFWSWK